MHQIRNSVLLLLAVGLTVASGFVQGKINQRWGPSTDAVKLGKRLESLPEEFGVWRTRADLPFSDNVKRILQCVGHTNRKFVDVETGEEVSVALIIGPPGPISVHTPEICFSSQGSAQKGGTQSVQVEDTSGLQSEYWFVDFESTGVDRSITRVYYGWSTDGKFSASENPRFTFVTSPYLMKVQLAVVAPDLESAAKNNVATRFLSDFVPILKKHLFPGSETSTK